MLKTAGQITGELEDRGEEQVRRDLSLDTYSGDRLKVAEEWLRLKDHERSRDVERRNLSSNDEQIRLARRANLVAVIAAITAIIAAIIAATSAFMSISG